jgi:predicted membrane protein
MNDSPFGYPRAPLDFPSPPYEAVVSVEQDSFDRGAVMEDLELRVQSRTFRGGSLTAVMCSVTLDLREAALAPDGATFSVQSALTGLDILVPRDWDVVCDVGAVWASVHRERFPPPPGAPQLRLTGMVVAGGLRVR